MCISLSPCLSKSVNRSVYFSSTRSSVWVSGTRSVILIGTPTLLIYSNVSVCTDLVWSMRVNEMVKQG